MIVRFFRQRSTRRISSTIASVFSAGEAYDSFMGRWSRHLAPLLVQFAGITDGDAVLDVGAGTGSLSAAVAAAAPSSPVTGIDPSAPYIAVARTRHQGRRMRFEVGDAQQLQFDDASFDLTISLLILNFIPDLERAVEEMIRVTRPGGTVAAAVWDYGEGMEMLRLFWDEAVTLAPDADVKDERHMPFCRRGELATLWRSHNLQNVSEAPLTIETRFASFEDYWSPFLEQQGPAGVHVATLSPRSAEQLRRNLRSRLLGDGPDGPITLYARAWAVRGTVSSPRIRRGS
jgi:SAM-dependent methyltransferase